MALPPNYSNCEDYFESALKFLKEYEWLYNYPNTDILLNKTYEKFPQEWILYFRTITNENLNNLALGKINSCEPKSLQKFVSTVNTLSCNYVHENIEINLVPNLRLTKKKLHEISNLAPYIHNVCSKNNIEYIIDVGAGLGYLSQLLYQKYGYKVLGVEGNKKYVETAIKNLPSNSQVKFAHHFVTSNSTDAIVNLLQINFKEFNSHKICIVALHACADLTIEIFNIFAKILFAENFIIMPCCYHRMKGGEIEFDNFPLSANLKSIYGEDRFLSRYFLRLACQQTSSIWKGMSATEHELHAKNCLYRNILQEVVVNDKLKLIRRKRKTGVKNCDFSHFVQTIGDHHRIVTETGGDADHGVVESIKKTVWENYANRYRDTECLIEALTGLQVLIQAICENVVLLDRCVYVRGNSLGLVVIDCIAEKVTDDRISPRCLALIATKSKI